jgi:hypothetical protein
MVREISNTTPLVRLFEATRGLLIQHIWYRYKLNSNERTQVG